MCLTPDGAHTDAHTLERKPKYHSAMRRNTILHKWRCAAWKFARSLGFYCRSVAWIGHIDLLIRILFKSNVRCEIPQRLPRATAVLAIETASQCCQVFPPQPAQCIKRRRYVDCRTIVSSYRAAPAIPSQYVSCTRLQPGGLTF